MTKVAQAADLFDGLDVEGLNDLIHKIRGRIEEISESTKQERIKSFLASDFFKEVKEKAKAIQDKIKLLPKTGEFTFTVVVKATGKKGEATVINSIIGYRRHSNNLLSAKAKVTAENASRARLVFLNEAVSDQIEDMCDDGWQVMFPELSKAHCDIDMEIINLRGLYEEQLGRCGLQTHDIFREET